jgi:peptide/nickel transport system permease protein
VGVLLRALLVLLLSGLAAATLTRFSPGFGLDERALDTRLSAESLENIQQKRAAERDPLQFYVHFLNGILKGDAGQSVVFSAPVAELIRERAPESFRTVALGLAGGWGAALLLAAAAVLMRTRAVSVASFGASGMLLSAPSAVLAAIALVCRFPAWAVVAGVVFPRVFLTSFELLASHLNRPHVLAARARGLNEPRVFVFHVVPAVLPPLFALAAVSITLAFGASIPVEVYLDSPGLGQLAWQAALGRDVPVLVAISLVLTVVAVGCNVLSDLAGRTFQL